ncbi:acetyl-CoA carboxylase biotin carboxyl carrier protein subunit [Xanthomarina sp. F2636L]|uniref:acetyl-CoA carboxylase biotin carboxyl carrier protein subunit n=1 Tax=Xanthomarina sp. F2636L TaxID=2996018 RepID=UPI00225DEAFB|nr:acetyl-CoA carboxylase biotin carboxyl carrier protein subunit [Xanthomarina sp. F2636L]MCX7550404.1 acetyl-CoA carboxylase biotin carboxyl carrier protein subunit [Xanthomarina sp. F2636L]
MNQSYKVNVNKAFDFDITSEEVSKLDAITVSSSEYHVLQENKSYKCDIISSDFNTKTYQVKVNNNTYNIDVFNDLDLLIKDMGFEVGASKMVNDIKAPMPGLILDIHVKVGQEVKEDDVLLILEAMKMENALTAPRDGIIKSISVSKSDTVDKNQLLIEFE